MIAQRPRAFGEAGWLNLVGGCCGTHTGHIAALARSGEAASSRACRPPTRRSTLSGVDYLEITDDKRPVIVGERTNVIGSRRSSRSSSCAEKFEEASEIARAQVKGGAQIIDVCLANPDRDELDDMRALPRDGRSRRSARR